LAERSWPRWACPMWRLLALRLALAWRRPLGLPQQALVQQRQAQPPQGLSRAVLLLRSRPRRRVPMWLQRCPQQLFGLRARSTSVVVGHCCRLQARQQSLGLGPILRRQRRLHGAHLRVHGGHGRTGRVNGVHGARHCARVRSWCRWLELLGLRRSQGFLPLELRPVRVPGDARHVRGDRLHHAHHDRLHHVRVGHLHCARRVQDARCDRCFLLRRRCP